MHFAQLQEMKTHYIKMMYMPCKSVEESLKDMLHLACLRHLCILLLQVWYLPGKYSLIHSLENVDFKKPVFAGDELFVTATVKDKQDDLHLIILDVVIRNQNNKVVSKASMKVLVQK